MLTATILSVLLLASQPKKSDMPAEPKVLDQKKIHTDYNDGNFEIVVKDIEKFQKNNPEYSKADSVFIAKHLSVVYSADPATREKGKYYMYRLLEMLPSAKLIDMYVSDEIDRIFDKVKEEFVLRQKSFGVDSSQMNIPNRAPATDTQSNQVAALPSTPGNQPQDKKSNELKSSNRDNKSIWIIAGVSAAAAGVAAAYLLASPSSTSNKGDKTYVIP